MISYKHLALNDIEQNFDTNPFDYHVRCTKCMAKSQLILPVGLFPLPKRSLCIFSRFPALKFVETLIFIIISKVLYMLLHNLDVLH